MALKDYGKFKIVETESYHEINKDERKRRILKRRKAARIENKLRDKLAA